MATTPKSSKKPASRAPARNRTTKPAAAKPTLTVPSLSLPPGYRAHSFEIVGDQVRVTGTVHSAAVAEGPCPVPAETSGEFVRKYAEPAPAPAFDPRTSMAVDVRGQLVAAIDGAACNIGELALVLDSLEDRMANVLEPAMPSPANQTERGDSVAPPHAPAVLQLHEQSTRLRNLIQRVVNLTNRVQA